MAARPVRDATRELTGFIDDFEEDMRLTVEHIEWFVEDRDLREKVRAAWPRVQSRFVTARAEIEKVTFEALEERGLTLEELDLKTALFHKRSDEFRAMVRDQYEQGWTRRACGFFKRLAGSADIVIGSLPIPGADAIGEVKDAVKEAGEAVEYSISF